MSSCRLHAYSALHAVDIIEPEDLREEMRSRSVFPSSQALLKALYLATFEATKKWTMPMRNWGHVYGELSIMYEGRLPE
jgi:transposase-like protein